MKILYTSSYTNVFLDQWSSDANMTSDSLYLHGRERITIVISKKLSSRSVQVKMSKVWFPGVSGQQ